ncbi:MAG: M14 family zinc carboxypeptidase [Ilumatobacteraceae bacterium]
MRHAPDAPAAVSASLVVVVIAVVVVSLAGCSRADDAISTDATTPITTAAFESTTTPRTPVMTVPTASTTASPATMTTTTTAPTTTTTTTAPTTTSTTTSTTTTTAPTATRTPTTVTVTAAPPPPAAAVLDALALPFDADVEIGRSVEGRPITVMRRGTASGTAVLVIGVIHGNEADGVAVIDRLAVEPVPDGVELWLVRSMNPDGQAIGDRQNAHLVDLNRNFPAQWGPLGEVGFWQYAGPSPASEPETQAIVALGTAIVPDLVFWYHQDLFRLSPGSGREGEARVRYAELTGLPIVEVTGGTYTGTAAQWAQTVRPDDGFSITVELGETLTAEQAAAHARAVLVVATELF